MIWEEDRRLLWLEELLLSGFEIERKKGGGTQEFGSTMNYLKNLRALCDLMFFLENMAITDLNSLAGGGNSVAS